MSLLPYRCLVLPQFCRGRMMDWPALRRFAEAIGPEPGPTAPESFEASDEDRAAVIGRLHQRDDGELLEELLIDLEEKQWARQAVIEELRRPRAGPAGSADLRRACAARFRCGVMRRA
jgi:hypothetical protein